MEELICFAIASTASSGVCWPFTMFSISVSTICLASGKTLSNAPAYSGAESWSWSIAVWNCGYCAILSWNTGSSCAAVVIGKYPVCAFQYACDSGEIRNFTNSHVARSFFESLLFSAHREAPPMDTPPSSLEDTFGKYAVPTSNFPFTSCRICFNEAVDPSVIADFPA